MEQARVKGDETGNQGYSLLGEGFSERVICSIKWHFLWRAHIDFFFPLPLLPHATDIPMYFNCAYSVSPNMHSFIMFLLMGKLTIPTVT